MVFRVLPKGTAAFYSIGSLLKKTSLKLLSLEEPVIVQESVSTTDPFKKKIDFYQQLSHV